MMAAMSFRGLVAVILFGFFDKVIWVLGIMRKTDDHPMFSMKFVAIPYLFSFLPNHLEQ